jgi:hypothetical protein
MVEGHDVQNDGTLWMLRLREGLRFTMTRRCHKGGLLELVTNPSAINESAPRLHRGGRNIPAPAPSIRARRDIVRMVTVLYESARYSWL